MPRRPRVFLLGQPIHLIQRGQSGSQVFFQPEDGQQYLQRLGDATFKHGLAVHAYVLMPNHVHLLTTPKTPDALSKAMRDINWHYTRYINATQGRTGSLWDGRYKACVVDAPSYLFRCMRYVELNPLRAGLASDAEQYRWSSYRTNAAGGADSIVSAHPEYLALGTKPKDRGKAYQALFETQLSPVDLNAIRTATNGGWALGSADFEKRAGKTAGQNMAPRGPGRPWPEKKTSA